jgi:hypothetical protein
VSMMRYMHSVHDVDCAELARWFDVHHTTAYHAVTGRTWKHLPYVASFAAE